MKTSSLSYHYLKQNPANLKVLIIEDEPRAASQLQSMLTKCNFEYDLLDIIDSIEDSVTWFQNHAAPDLVFLDIQLADGLSFEIFQKVQIDAPIIFTTAFDQYAIQAFKVNSIDYLLKPIQEDKLNAALEKFEKTSAKKSIDPALLTQLISSMENKKQRVSILVKQGSGLVQLKVSELLYAYSEDGITFGVTSDKRYMIDETMDQLLASLDPDTFFRINRGQLVSRGSINKIEPYFNHRVKLEISNPKDQEFIVSRPKTKEFKDWLNS